MGSPQRFLSKDVSSENGVGVRVREIFGMVWGSIEIIIVNKDEKKNRL
jgi:hypothetical protein